MLLSNIPNACLPNDCSPWKLVQSHDIVIGGTPG